MSQPVASIKLPYLCSDKDRHGNVRHYVRLPGKAKVRIYEKPYSEAFLVRYWDIRRGVTAAKTKVVPMGPGTFGHMVNSYLASPAFKDELNAKNTQPARRRLLLSLVQRLGHRAADVIGEQHFRDGMAARTHGARKNFHVTLRGLYRWALEHGKVKADPTVHVPLKKKKTLGHHTWTIEDCEKYEACWPENTKARLVYALALYTACRLSNVVRLGPQNEHGDLLTFLVRKNADTHPLEVTIPIVRPLRAALDTGPVGTNAYVETEDGQPFSEKGIGNAFRRWCDVAGLPHCSMHGLRKAAATRLAEAGATEYEIMAILGHSTPQESATYTRAAGRKRMASSGMNRLYGEQIVPPSPESGTLNDKVG